MVISSKVPEILPAPFAWVEIPGGHGMMKMLGGTTLEIPSKTYWMSKYPITNAQYAKFMEAGGYTQEKWWTMLGWEWKQIKNWTAPRFWDDNDFNGAEQPIVGVSWLESVAFCLWLSDVTSETIMLPTEAQWQYAAQGDDGRAYPWGNKWKDTRCNHNVGGEGIGKTTPVRHYEGTKNRLVGKSPFGVVDMVGNVYEWCLTDYGNGMNNIYDDAPSRRMRGSSWYDDIVDIFRCDYRGEDYDSFLWDNNLGFRIALA